MVVVVVDAAVAVVAIAADNFVESEPTTVIPDTPVPTSGEEHTGTSSMHPAPLEQ